MRIMVLGAGGFIGRQIMAELRARGHDLVGVVRDRADLASVCSNDELLEIDLARETDPRDWENRLQGIDCIVNAAGILRGKTMEAIHVQMPSALTAAADRVGVKHVVLISAISARADVATDYAVSKLAGEAVLRASGVNWTILRPSLVYGEGSYGGTSLMRGMAGLPFVVPLPGHGEFRFTPIHVRDLARAVGQVCGETAWYGKTLEPAGPETLSLRQVLDRYRAWLGFGQARFLPIPMPLMRLMGRAGDIVGDGPIATNSLVQMIAGNAGDSAAFATAIGFRPTTLDEALLAHPAQVQDRWHARLFFLAPAIKAVLILLWLASAALGLFCGAQAAQQVVVGLGLPPGAAEPLRIGGSVLDLGIAALLLLEKRVRWSTYAQLAAVIGYSIVIGIAVPRLWFDPLGPLIKNLPILLLIAVHGAIGEKR